MEITGTLTKLKDYFQKLHTDYYREWHNIPENTSIIQEVVHSQIASAANDEYIIQIANLLGKKIDNGATINSLNDIQTLLNRATSQDNSINLADMNNRINSSSKNFYEGEIIPDGSDLNDYIEVGVFRHTQNNVISEIENAPEGLNTRFNLRVLKSSSTTIVQILSTYTNNDIYIRNRQNANTEWNAWSRIYNSDRKIIATQIGWGEEFASTPGPIDTSMVPDISANRLAFLPSDCIGIYTNSDGTQYNPANQTPVYSYDLMKRTFISRQYKLYGGNQNTTALLNENDINKKIIIEINAKTPNNKYAVYAHLRRIYVHVNKGRCNVVKVKIQVQDDTETEWINWGEEEYSLLGASGGWNAIPLNMYFGNYDNKDPSDTITHYNKIRLTFWNQDTTLRTKTTQENPITETDKPEMYYVDAVRFIGEQIFTAPSAMAETGHIYTYDGDQNVTFPNNISSRNLTTRMVEKYRQPYNDEADVRLGTALYVNEAIRMAELRIIYKPKTAETDKVILTLDANEYAPRGWNIYGITNWNTIIQINHESASANPRKVILQGTLTANHTYQGHCIWFY